MRSCQPRPRHSTEIAAQGGVVRLLSRQGRTGEGGEVGSVAVFDGGNGAPIVGGGGEGFLQLEGSTKG
jgi:hypothetical protein